MASFLYRLGSGAFRRRGLVLTVWLVSLAGVGVGAAVFSAPTSDTFTIPGTQSQSALDLLSSRFPAASAGNASAQLVISAPAGQTVTSAQNHATIENVVKAIGRAPQVGNAADPFLTGTVSKDGSTAIVSVSYKVTAPDVSDAARAALTHVAADARHAGLTVDYAGTAAQAGTGVGGTETLGLVIAAVVLLITFGSMIAAGLPLLNALIGVGVTFLGIEVVSGFVTLSSTTSTLALMVGIAVAIDYSLFIVSRYRHELEEGRAPREAAGRAVATAGSAVVFAGMTVIIALAGLSVVRIPFLTTMGLAAAGSVLVAVCVALTLLPALLGLAGANIFSRAQRRRMTRPAAPTGTKKPAGERWGQFAIRRRWIMLPASVIVLLLCAIPALSLRTSLSTAQDPTTTQGRATTQIDHAFGPGYNGTLLVVIDHAKGAALTAAATEAQKSISALRNVSLVSPATPNPARDVAILTVVPATGPATAATEKLVLDIRDQAKSFDAENDARLQVTGETALNIDVSDRLASALVPYVVLIVVFALLLLLVMFRSVLVPLKAVIGFLLSLVASLGAVVAVFQWGWLDSLFGITATGPIMSILPIFLVGLLFGLSMDYEVFLVTRMHEEHGHGATPHEAIVAGMRHGTRVVTAAALIMISVFAGFITGDQVIIKSIGFALAFGVLVDAFLVRMTTVPAVMSLLGKTAWWAPRWLARILPRIDVEGSELAEPAPAPAGCEPPLGRRPSDEDQAPEHGTDQTVV
ncbi:MAG TPA: MMPL family transporter [Gryllotalpicola sp.]